MKISALRLFNVKRFAGRGVAIEGIGDGVNVLCAANEFGKSTSFEALHALFFQPYSGTPGDVQKLRPYSGGNPLVEVDITTVEGRFRVTKQYYGGRFARVTDLSTGRLAAQADEAENFIAGLIKGGTAGPAGLLWVRQGITGIERRSRSEEDSEKQVRASLLESVQGEVEAITGGRRMAEIMAAVQDALGELVTATGRPRAGGRYLAAIAERDSLDTEEARLAAEVALLREALDKRAAAVKRLAELDRADEIEGRRKAVEKAQSALDAARAHGEKLKTAEAELRLVRERRDAAAREMNALRAAMEKAGALQAQLHEAGQRRDEALGRRRDIAARIDAARAQADVAEARGREAADLLARLDAALKARDAFERIAALQERLKQAEAARQAIEQGEAKLALVRVPPRDVEDLQTVEIEIAKLRAVAEAARPSVTIVYEAGAAGSVTMDGMALLDGETHGYDGHASLSLPGIGTMTLRTNRPEPRNDALERAEARRRALLAGVGVSDLAEARERQSQAQRQEEELRELRGRLTLLAPEGLPSLRAETAASGSAGTQIAVPEGDPSQARSVLAEAEEQRRNARQSLQEAEPLRGRIDEAYVQAEAALAALKADQAHVEAALGPMDARSERETALANTLGELAGMVALAQGQVDGLRAAAVDLASIEASLSRARSVEDAAEKEANALRQAIAGLNAEIRTRSDEAAEEKWREKADALAAATVRVAAFEKEVAVLQRLSGALESARSEARELYLKPVMAELGPLLGLLFDDVSITFDDRTLLPQTILRNGQEEEVERLSGGMREQLSVLTRLAFARLLARDGRPAPVILDDALVYSDDDRIEKMFDALHRQSRDQQIIVFSCRQRAFQKLGGNILHMTDWHP